MISKALPNDPEWLYQHQVADKYLEDFSRAFLAAVDRLHGKLDMDALEQAIANDQGVAFVEALPWAEEFEQPLGLSFGLLFDKVLAEAGREAWARLNLQVSFEIRNPYAEEWIKSHGAELIVQVSDETKAAVRRIVHDGFVAGHAPRQMAMRIREIVGLTEREAKAVLNYWERVSQEADLTAARVDAMADTYAQKLRRKRALRIARQESLRASNEGTRQSWMIARDQGFVLPESRRVWIAATASCRTCKICLALDGKEAGLDEPFHCEYGDYMAPPGHILCRCAQSLRTVLAEKRADLRKYKTNEELPGLAQSILAKSNYPMNATALFRHVVNEHLAKGETEAEAFTAGWGAVESMGWLKRKS